MKFRVEQEAFPNEILERGEHPYATTYLESALMDCHPIRDGWDPLTVWRLRGKAGITGYSIYESALNSRQVLIFHPDTEKYSLVGRPLPGHRLRLGQIILRGAKVRLKPQDLPELDNSLV